MTITQSELIARRREQVYVLHWKGKSSREIATTLGCSFKTVCLDIEWLTENANQEIKEQRKAIALEYKEAVSSFNYLLEKAFGQFDKAVKEGNEDRMESLYPILESLIGNLLATRSTGDLVEKEQLIYEKDQTAKKLAKQEQQAAGQEQGKEME